MDRQQHFTGDDAYKDACRKARYGHRDWLWWRDRQGIAHATPKTPETMKSCLLAVGTRKGAWTLISGDTGIPFVGFWWLGINMLAQMKRGWI